MKFISRYKPYLRNKNFLLSSTVAVILLFLSLVVNLYAGTYATEKASNPVTDIILSNIRVFDVDGIFVYGTIIFWVFTGILSLTRPRCLPFTIKTLALFVFIRSVFISLTHIGPFPSQLIIYSGIISKFSFGGDLFFSGHTGLPFLMALIFWDEVYLRILFILSAIFFGILVLLAHLHYSIDVLSAFFITYAIYHLSEVLFKKDRKIFMVGL